METALSLLREWESFYVIVGSSSAALIGLQFVVIALLADRNLEEGSTRNVDTWGTPTVMHFSAVLLMAAIVSAPWRGLSSPALMLGACGIAGVAYGVITLRRATSISTYKPVFEDWLWHIALPLVSHVVLVVSALALPLRPRQALFGVAVVTLLLLFIGIHNAWDTVTYIAVGQREAEKQSR